MDVFVNGEERQVPRILTVAGLLDALGILPDRVAIELNRAIVRKRDWQTATVEPGSQIEIVEFVGGG